MLSAGVPGVKELSTGLHKQKKNGRLATSHLLMAAAQSICSVIYTVFKVFLRAFGSH